MTDIEAKVIRAYRKGVSATVMSAMGICGYEKATGILKKYGLLKKHGYFEDGKRRLHTP